jgi:hypothetical protein
MRKTLGVCLLALLLTGSASAGIIPNDAPAPTAATVEDGTQGTFQGGVAQAVLDLLAALF